MGETYDALEHLLGVKDGQNNPDTPPLEAEKTLREMKAEARLRDEKRKMDQDEMRARLEQDQTIARLEAQKQEEETRRTLAVMERRMALNQMQPQGESLNATVLQTLGTLIQTLSETSFGKNSELLGMLTDRLKGDLEELKTRTSQQNSPAQAVPGISGTIDQLKQLLDFVHSLQPNNAPTDNSVPIEAQLRLREFDVKIRQWEEDNHRWWEEFRARQRKEEQDAKATEQRFSILANQLVPQLGSVLGERLNGQMAAAGQTPPARQASQAEAVPAQPAQVGCSQENCDGIIVFHDPEAIMRCPKCKTPHELNTPEESPVEA